MPQKRNPDAAELVRAVTGKLNGNLINLLTILKGLSLTYSKDMQEDKEPLFNSYDKLKLSIIVTSRMVDNMEINKENMKKHANYGYSTATEIADFLVREKKITFRKAHHITGEIVKICRTRKKRII